MISRCDGNIVFRSYAPYLRDKRDRAGTVPLFLRIAHKEGTRYLSLGLRVKDRYWNGSAQQGRKSNPDHVQLNTCLAATTAEAQRAVADL